MKKLPTLLILGAVCIVGACKKKKDDSVKYIVNDVQDINIRQYRDTVVMVSPELEYQSGTQEPIAVSLTGLPAGITSNIASRSGTPSFKTSFTLSCYATAPGRYPVSVTTTGEQSGTKTTKFNLIVDTASCPDYGELLGAYTASMSCDNGTTVTSEYIMPGPAKNKVVFDFVGRRDTVTINCDTRSFTLPLKQHSSYESSGTGTYTKNKTIINWTFRDTFAPYTVETCTETYSRP